MLVNANIVLPSQLYNTIMIFVTVITLLWAIKAAKRMYTMFRIRSSVLNDRIIQIRGLGSYLAYFEGATQPHINAIVHTRQTKPPVSMNIAFVPYSIYNTCLVKCGSHNHVFEFNLSTSVNCKLIVLFGFKNAQFTSMFNRFRKLNAQHVNDDGTSQIVFLENLLQMGPLYTEAKGLFDQRMSTETESPVSSSRFNNSYERSVQMVQNSTPLNYSGSCQFEVLVQDVAPGVHHLRFALLDRMIAAVDAHHKSFASKQATAARRAARAAAQPAPVVVDGGADPAAPVEAPAPAAPTTETTTPRAVVEDFLSIAVLLVPNGISAQNISSSSSSSSSAAELLQITRSNPPTGMSTQTPVSTSSSVSSSASFEMTSVVKASGGMSPRKVSPEVSVNVRDGADVESGGTSNRQSSSSDRTSCDDVETLLASSGATTGGVSGKKKKSKNEGAVQSSAPVCSGVFSFSVPFAQLAAFYTGSEPESERSARNSFVSTSGVQVSTISPLQRSATPETSKYPNTANEKNLLSEPAEPVSIPMSPAEVLVIDPLCNLYASQEIFGLNPVVVAPPVVAPVVPVASATSTSPPPPNNPPRVAPSSASPTPALSATSAFSTGGKYVEEDCVVCLTDPKEIALLPCRHLCVCTACLIYIDKCPVCRASFEEYVVIKSKEPISMVLPVAARSGKNHQQYQQQGKGKEEEESE